jgi:hypothetical protein
MRFVTPCDKQCPIIPAKRGTVPRGPTARRSSSSGPRVSACGTALSRCTAGLCPPLPKPRDGLGRRSSRSTRCPKLPGKLSLLSFAGAERHAASTVERPTLPRTALRTAALVVVLLVASTLWTGAQPAAAGSPARFEPGPCPPALLRWLTY